ncbi:hypothetical protein GGX14DRAFT_665621 [Mycena pura]|uniref:Mediator of RNA polymerase II transcription subunit 13 n=1 Tax=Mycena pura TaxID=153505 RepID=A0AAD6V6E1_9AGAR|nr:hypothetical protein GGX14DRAFT_665621 [Mycena pura]
MATKAPPLRMAASDKLLSSAIRLPKDVLISCYVFSPLAGPSSQSRAYNDILEMARRDVLLRNSDRSATLTGSVLTSVHIRGGDSRMYAFLIGRQGQPATELSTLHFDGLSVTSQISFAPSDIYPSCSSCPNPTSPCQACAQQHLPHQPLRTIYSHFLEAVRMQLIDNISDASYTKQPGRKRLVKRFKGGFTLGPPPSSTEWSKGWENHASSRPLVFCQLQIHISASPQPQIIIHPQLHTTPFLALPHGPGRPLPEGAPITLLPHGTPAFYLASYSGPTSALRRQFHESLKGLGVCGWDAEEGDDHWLSSKNHPERRETTFIIAWISVENKQGEDKGITVIYPSSLCLSFVPCATSSTSCAAGRREPLAYIPELPPQLQPSPQVTAASPAMSTVFPPAVQSHLQESTRPSSCPTTPSPHALRAFRTLTHSRSRALPRIASEVNGYIDAVAKEREKERERQREKERERLRRERERDGGSPRPARANTSGGAAASPAATPVSALPTSQTPVPAGPPPAPAQPITGPSQQPIQNQPPSTFYPSPPQVDPLFTVLPNESRTSPVVPDPPLIPDVTAPTPAVTSNELKSEAQAPQLPPPTFDPFDSQAYMDIDIAMNELGGIGNMGGMIDIGMGMNFGIGDGRDDRQREAASLDFETDFTDDDFSFFDRPQHVVPAVPLSIPRAPSAVSLTESYPGAGLTPAAGPAPLGMNGMLGMSPPLFGDSPAAHPLQGDWPGAVGVFTPGPEMHHMMVIPDLPPSPGDTPNSHAVSAPATPNVRLEGDRALILRASSAGLGQGYGIFDPIPFADSHRVADGKYAMGKFALPSPPPEADDEYGLEGGVRLGSAFTFQDTWRSKYASVTDPRIGVVRKLIGVKRKTSTMDEGGRRTNAMSPSWVREHEDWEKRLPEEEEAKSEPESESDDAEEDSPLESRPSTPPPAYLPLGPTLLHTHFQHSYLLPLSTPLRPPGAAVAPTNMTTLASAASASVPTPVSPAATLGAASGKSKSLEAAAFSIGKEVVENSIWAEAWHTNMMGTFRKQSADAVWPADVKTVAQLLQLVPDVEGPLDIELLFNLDPTLSKSVQTLEPPMISIGKANAVIQVLPTALRFWEKLGLSPKGGSKDATVFVLFEDDGDARQRLAEAWLAKVAAMYHSKHLGTLTPGSHNLCASDGIFSLRFDSTFRKTLAAFVSSLPPLRSRLLFYVFTPLSMMSLASPLLRQVFSSVKKVLQEQADALFQLVPEALVACSTNRNPAQQVADLEAVCYSTYDRILQPVDRVMSRQFFEHGEPIRGYFQDPAYSLARPLHATVKYVQRVKAPLDVVDAGTFLHVGGEAHELAVWLTQTQAASTDGEESDVETFTNEQYAIRKVWDFACRFAKRANVAWRVVFAKLGSIATADLNASMMFLSKAVHTTLPEAHVTLLSVEPDAPWSFLPPHTPSKTPTPTPTPAPTPAPNNNTKLHPSLPPKPMARVPSSSSTKMTPLFIDVSSTTYAIFPKRHLPLSLPPTPSDLGLVLPYVAEAGCSSPTSTSTPGPSEAASPVSATTFGAGTGDPEFPHPVPVRPLSTALLVRVPAASISGTASMLHVDLLATFPQDADTNSEQLLAEITRSYHDLAVLTAARWKLAQSAGADPILPFHLAAVDAMRTALLERDGVSP